MARIALLNRSYTGVTGGVEAQSLWLASQLVTRGHEVHLISWDIGQLSSPFGIPREAIRHPLGAEDPQRPASNRERIQRHVRLRRLLLRENVNVAIAYQQGMALSTILSTRFTRTKVIAAERNSPQLFNHVARGRSRRSATVLLSHANAVVVQWARYKDMYPPAVRRKISVIPNPVTIPAHTVDEFTSAQMNFRILCVGRFSYQKNQESLVRGLGIANREGRIAIRCDLVGDGEDYERLRHLVDTLGLEAHVTFLGPRRDWTGLLPFYDSLVAPSRWEGFPNAVAEALARGVPVLGFSRCDGVSDLVQDGLNGLLEPGETDEHGVARLLRRFYELDLPARSWAAQARCSVEHFSDSSVGDEWADLIARVRGGP